MAATIPKTTVSLTLPSKGQPFRLVTHPSPASEAGSAVVRILASTIASSHHRIFVQGARAFPPDFVPGGSAVGRVLATGSDAVSLEPGQLVLVDVFIHARDDPSAKILLGLTGGFLPASKKLMRDAWPSGTWTQTLRVPLESCFALDEARLTGSPADGGLGYQLTELPYITRLAVAYGGACAAEVRPGGTVIVGPATGHFSGAAAEVCAALGAARIVCVGRNAAVLSRLKRIVPRVETVVLAGDAAQDGEAIRAACGSPGANSFLEISPAANRNPTHIRGAIDALVVGGKIALQGAPGNCGELPYSQLLRRELTMRGAWMCTREQMRETIRMVEGGVAKLGREAGHEMVGVYSFEEWEEGLRVASEKSAWGQQVVFTP